MSTYSSILAKRIPWTEEPGGLQLQVCKESGTTEVTQHANPHSLIRKISVVKMSVLPKAID